MEFDFDRLKEQGIDLACKAKETALDLANKGKMQAQLLDQQAKLSKAQRQLGALVYSLRKSGEDNEPLVEKYVESIDEIEQNIADLKTRMNGGSYTEPEAEVVIEVEDDGEEDAEAETKVCPQCGQPVEGEELFCSHCGAQL